MALFGKRVKLEALCREFEAVIKRRCRGTSKAHRTDVNRLREAVRLLDADYCGQLTAPAVARALNVVEGRGRKPKTVNAYREILHRLCAFLLREKGLALGANGVNPVSLIPRRPEDDPLIVYLTLEEFDALLEGMAQFPQLRLMVAVMALAGLRRSEVLWLTGDDVDLVRRLISVRAKTIGGEHWRPKTGRNRSVPISDRLLAEFRRHGPPPRGAWFFASPKGCRWDPDNLSHALVEAQKQLGTRWTALHFRHTFGSQLAKRGVSLYKISKLMGNTPDVCRRHYAALLSEELTEEVEFAGAPPAEDHDGEAVDDGAAGTDVPDGGPVAGEPPQTLRDTRADVEDPPLTMTWRDLLKGMIGGPVDRVDDA